MSESQCFIEKSGSFPMGSWKWKAAKLTARYRIVNAMEMLTGSPRSRHTNGKQPTILVGPIIGKVTKKTARILLEVRESTRITVKVEAEAEGNTAMDRTGSGTMLWRAGSSIKNAKLRKEKTLESEPQESRCKVIEKEIIGKRPTVFVFTGLRPGTRYLVKVDGCDGATNGSFRTFPELPTQTVNVGVVSCNKIFITQKTITPISDLWAHLAKLIEAGEIDFLVHLGDQIYGDGDKMQDAEAGKDRDKWSNRFRMAKTILRELPKESWKYKQEEICEKYREVYRETWQHPHTAKCLANCCNLMIYDDHEVRDNWGDIPEDWDPESLDFFIARCAWIVALEYQRQLFEDVDFSNLQAINKDYHFHVVGGVGLMFLDIRGSRTFHRVEGDERPYLGSLQWSDIKKALTNGGIFDKTRALLVCSPAPLVFLEPKITNTAAKNVNRLEDFKGHWSAHSHRMEQVEMIECLQNWKSSQKGREVLVLGGDVHCGGHSVILKNNKVLFHQLTTSAIANMPLPKSAYYFMRAAGRLGKLHEDYTFTHNFWTRSRNYAVVQIRNYRAQDIGDTEIVSQLIRGKFMRPIRVGPQVSNLEETPNAGCIVCFCSAGSENKEKNVA